VIRAVGVRKEKIAGIGRTQGNSTETIAKNKKLYDYSKVPQPQLGKAKKWFGALKPTAKKDTDAQSLLVVDEAEQTRTQKLCASF
jgi:hypothetical protein